MNSNNMAEEVQLGDCEINPLISKRGHFMNSILSVPNMYSCAVDTFLEVSSHLFLPYLSTMTVRNEFTELLFNTCKRYIESQGNDRMLREIREPICPSFSQGNLMHALVRFSRNEPLVMFLQRK